MVNNEDMLQKIGRLLSDLSEQYEQLKDGVDDASLTYFEVNAQYLSGHIAVLKKLLENEGTKADAIKPAPEAVNDQQGRTKTEPIDQGWESNPYTIEQSPIAGLDIPETEFTEEEQRVEGKQEEEEGGDEKTGGQPASEGGDSPVMRYVDEQKVKETHFTPATVGLDEEAEEFSMDAAEDGHSEDETAENEDEAELKEDGENAPDEETAEIVEEGADAEEAVDEKEQPEEVAENEDVDALGEGEDEQNDAAENTTDSSEEIETEKSEDATREDDAVDNSSVAPEEPELEEPGTIEEEDEAANDSDENTAIAAEEPIYEGPVATVEEEGQPEAEQAPPEEEAVGKEEEITVERENAVDQQIETQDQPAEPASEHLESGEDEGVKSNDAQGKQVIIEEKTVEVVKEDDLPKPSRPVSLNDLFSARRKADQTQLFQEPKPAPVAPPVRATPVKIHDLKSAISLNDKLLFIKDLFNGYSLAYTEALDLLSRYDNFEEADAFLQETYAVKNNWTVKQTTVDKFYAILKQKYGR